jgi:hypothetical protein
MDYDGGVGKSVETYTEANAKVDPQFDQEANNLNRNNQPPYPTTTH